LVRLLAFFFAGLAFFVFFAAMIPPDVACD
jgi:hypothetical protein